MSEQPRIKNKTEIILEVGARQPVARLADTSAELEQALEKEKSDRKKERFGWICGVSALALPLIYHGVDGSIVAFSIITVIVLCMLIVVAKMCGCEEVAILLSAMTKRLMRTSSDTENRTR